MLLSPIMEIILLLGGTASRFVDISATLNHIVPTVQAYYKGNLF
jgi:hypothetical protein